MKTSHKFYVALYFENPSSVKVHQSHLLFPPFTDLFIVWDIYSVTEKNLRAFGGL
uniref:Uncharacterized protein n=1 Tax=Rhizophora mucronata TaxID=61149 RepID=A0A2P2IS58_RHIMU